VRGLRVTVKRVAGISKTLTLSPHALQRIEERLGWDGHEIRRAAKEVGRIYHGRHYGEVAEIQHENATWVVAPVGNTAVVKTVIDRVVNYSLDAA
jgi:hypothetical protein